MYPIKSLNIFMKFKFDDSNSPDENRSLEYSIIHLYSLVYLLEPHGFVEIVALVSENKI